MKKICCRFCGNKLNHDFINLGLSPLSNSFLKKEELNKNERYYPLDVKICEKCYLVQLTEYENPKNIFQNYAYFSSYSKSWLEHAKNFVQQSTNRLQLTKKSLVIEIASNDGYLLQYFQEKKINILGIEPATNVADTAIQKGIPTLKKFFGKEVATKLFNEKKQADLIIANNVLAHVPDLNDFILGLKILLKPTGMITIEVPHLMKLIQENQFDTIYHEHFSYFSLFTLQKIFKFHDLKIIDVEELSTHGGSLRLFIAHYENQTQNIQKTVEELIKKEIEFGINNIECLKKFSKKVNEIRINICEFFEKMKQSNKKIIGYGAPAKANTLLNFCSIGTDFINFTVDANPHKQGLFLPGTHIPIKNPESIKNFKPDFVIILPWNLKDEITEQFEYIKNWGGKFVILIPEIKILE